MRERSGANTVPQASGREYAAIVRTDVIDAAVHWLGNLLQRLRALEQKLEGAAHPLAPALGSTVGDLDRFARLLLDYIAEPPARLESVRAGDLVSNLVLSLRQSFEVELEPSSAGELDDELLLNVEAVTKAVGYMPSLLLGGGSLPGAKTTVRVCTRSPGDRLEIEVFADRGKQKLDAAGELCFAVIEKYFVTQGGEFQCAQDSETGQRWVIVLPLRRANSV